MEQAVSEADDRFAIIATLDRYAECLDTRDWAGLAAGGGDIVPLTERIPARVVARLLALPQRDIEHFRRWAMMGGDMLAGHIDATRMHYLPSRPMPWQVTWVNSCRPVFNGPMTM